MTFNYNIIYDQIDQIIHTIGSREYTNKYKTEIVLNSVYLKLFKLFKFHYIYILREYKGDGIRLNVTYNTVNHTIIYLFSSNLGYMQCRGLSFRSY